MNTKIVYMDETGDDGANTSSSNYFVLTSMYMPADSWQNNYDIIKSLRKYLKKQYGLHSTEEMHTKHFVTDKDPYRKYEFTITQRQEILRLFTKCITRLDVKFVNVIIDKTKISNEMNILDTALTYSIQRVENDSNGSWNYLVITDKGRLKPMRQTARRIRKFNMVPSHFSGQTQNKPIKYLIEDIIEKDSAESYFIQLCDFVSYFVFHYYNTVVKKNKLPTRAQRIINEDFIQNIINRLKTSEKLNLKACKWDTYGFVIYPK